MSDEPPKTTPLDDVPAGELPIGTSLNSSQYKIQQVIASGGFGITYLAEDNLRRDVALKECFPLGLATRTAGRSVSAASSSTSGSFDTARELFLREARLLAGLSHPNVVHVQTLFEENGTAYMAMDFIHGDDLHSVVSKYPERVTPDWVVELATAMLGALGYLHGESCLHRDIKPSNIRIDRFRIPILIDFGAARQETQLRSRLAGSFRVVSDGYSPNEFYISGAEQGPASDLYSLAATLYYVISGAAPASADARAQKVATGEEDPYEPLSGRFPEHNSALLAMIDQAMSMSLKDRPKDAETWLAAIAPASTPQAAAPLTMLAPSTPEVAPAPAQNDRLVPGIGIGAAVVALLAGGYFLTQSGGEDGAEVDRLTTELAEEQAETERLTGELQTVEGQLQSANDQIADLQATNDDLQRQLSQQPRVGPTTNGSGNGTGNGSGPSPLVVTQVSDLTGDWSLVATCPLDLMQAIGINLTRVFGTLTVTSHNGSALTGTYVNNLGQTATTTGTVNGNSVSWTASWTTGGAVTMIDVQFDGTGQRYSGMDSGGCSVMGSRIN